MKLFHKSKDGGADSNVTGYWLIEAKSLFSIVLLRFDKGSREAFHNHAFNAVSWVLKGKLWEIVRSGNWYWEKGLLPSFKPVYTSRDRMHQVHGIAEKTWVLSFRGPWASEWKEYLPKEDKEVTLTNGRKIVDEN
jgi:hypothetical protein